jgi:hypothetical protein
MQAMWARGVGCYGYSLDKGRRVDIGTQLTVGHKIPIIRKLGIVWEEVEVDE